MSKHDNLQLKKSLIMVIFYKKITMQYLKISKTKFIEIEII